MGAGIGLQVSVLAKGPVLRRVNGTLSSRRYKPLSAVGCAERKRHGTSCRGMARASACRWSGEWKVARERGARAERRGKLRTSLATITSTPTNRQRCNHTRGHSTPNRTSVLHGDARDRHQPHRSSSAIWLLSAKSPMHLRRLEPPLCPPCALELPPRSSMRCQLFTAVHRTPVRWPAVGHHHES